MYKAAIVLASLFLLGCAGQNEKSGSYIDSLVDAEIKALSLAKGRLIKNAQIKTAVDQAAFTPDSTMWRRELDMFRQLNAFERPAYRSSYRVTDRVRDKQSNLLVRVYTATADVPVPEMKFYYLDRFTNLKKIEGVYRETSTLYAFRRSLFMEFEDVNGQPLLKTFGMEGSQKMLLGDSVRFSVRSVVHF